MFNKNIMILMSTFIIMSYGMDKHVVEYQVLQTKIRIKKGHIASASGKVDLMVLGKNEQLLLHKQTSFTNEVVGQMSKQPSVLFMRHKDDDSCSDDDTFSGRNRAEWHKKAVKVIVNNEVIEIVDPRVSVFINEGLNNLSYSSEREAVGPNSQRKAKRIFIGSEASLEACSDLCKCYMNALYYGIERGFKSIALTIGTESGISRENIARTAVISIFQFIQQKHGIYQLIALYPKKQAEFDLYNKMVKAHVNKLFPQLK